MKFLERRRLVNTLMIGSILLNVGMLAYLANSGGLRRIFMKWNAADVSPVRAGFQIEDESRFRKLPNRPDGVIFAGDSLIAAGPWAEYYSSVHNRGIGGETTSGFLTRLDEVTEDKPRKVVLLLGANDLSAAVLPSRILANYRKILERIRLDSPSTLIDVISVLPVNRTIPNGPTYTNEAVREVNDPLKKLAEEFPGTRFVDVTDCLADEAGNLRKDLTSDGLHLNFEGYQAIRERLEGTVFEGEPRKAPQESASR